MSRVVFTACIALVATGCIHDVPRLPDLVNPRLQPPMVRTAAMASAASARPVTAGAAREANAQALTTFLNVAFEEDLKRNPQRATRIGRKDNYDKLDDYSDASIDQDLAWRRRSVADMRAKFSRDGLTPAAQMNFDIWALELVRAEDAARYRKQDYVFGFNRSPHSGLPNFMISNHLVDTPADMEAYIARLSGFSRALDQSTDRAKDAAEAGVRMPKFQYDRVLAESRKVVTGQPFAASGADSPLWADAKTKIAKLKIGWQNR